MAREPKGKNVFSTVYIKTKKPRELLYSGVSVP